MKREPDFKNVDEVEEDRFTTGGTLGKDAILHFKEKGLIHIHPFNENQLNMNSYDITLGNHYWTMIPKNCMNEIGLGIMRDPPINKILDPYNKNQVDGLWVKREAVSVRKHWKAFKPFLDADSLLLHFIHDSYIIIVNPGDFILAHSREYIGGRQIVFGVMSSRSSIRRFGIDICRCAGFGDVGYVYRWTMEISNTTQIPVLLVVGNRYAQIEFRMVVTNSQVKSLDYIKGDDAKYQSAQTQEDLEKKWTPEDMLPKKYKDREMKEEKPWEDALEFIEYLKSIPKFSTVKKATSFSQDDFSLPAVKRENSHIKYSSPYDLSLPDVVRSEKERQILEGMKFPGWDSRRLAMQDDEGEEKEEEDETS